MILIHNYSTNITNMIQNALAMALKSNFDENTDGISEIEVDFGKVCRLCLSEDEEALISLHNSNPAPEDCMKSVPEKIFDLMSIKVALDDGFPSWICRKCQSEVDNCIHFFNTCRNSQKALYDSYVNALIEAGINESLIQSHLTKKGFIVDSTTLSKLQKLETVKQKEESRYEVKESFDEIKEDFVEEVVVEDDFIEDSYLCSDCAKVFSTEEELLTHRISVHHDDLVTDASNVHTTANEATNSWTCNTCGAKFKSRSAIASHLRTQHLKINNEPTPYYKVRVPCRYCGISYCHAQLGHHLEAVHRFTKDDWRGDPPKTKSFDCQICFRTLRGRQNFRTHIKKAHGDSLEMLAAAENSVLVWRCYICDSFFNEEIFLMQHYVSKHFQHPADVDSHRIVKTKDMICDCGAISANALDSSIHNIFYHFREDQNDINLECPSCNEQCTTLSDLKKHLISYHWFVSTSYENECAFCDSTFETNNQLRIHLHEEHNISFDQISNAKRMKLDEKERAEFSDSANEEETVSSDQLVQSSKPKSNLLYCRPCGKYFETEQEFQNHSGSCQLNHACTMCERTFTSDTFLERHIVEYHNTKNVYKCLYCPQVFSHNMHLQKHYKYKHLPKYVCSYCGESLKGKLALKIHEDRIHRGISTAPSTFNQRQVNGSVSEPKSALSEIENNDSREDKQVEVEASLSKNSDACGDKVSVSDKVTRESDTIICNLCSQTFSTKLALWKHKRLRCKGRYKFYGASLTPLRCCKACNKRFSDASSFEQHDCQQNLKVTCRSCHVTFYNVKHLMRHMSYSKCKGKRFYGPLSSRYCRTCKKSFRNSINFSQHVCFKNLPGKKKIFTCNWCKETFGDKSGFEKHKCSKYTCEYCDNTFASRSNLRRHKRGYCKVPKPTTETAGSASASETSAKFSCNSCNKIFGSSLELEQHECDKTEDPASVCETSIKFDCSSCKKTFSDASGLDQHECRVEGTKTPTPTTDIKYSCKTCGQTLYRSTHLKRHMNGKCIGKVIFYGSAPTEGRFCSWCEKKFSNALSCARHDCECDSGDDSVVIPETIISFKCLICNRTFSEASRFDRHECDKSKHSAPVWEAVIFCKTCRGKFSDEASLEKHECHRNLKTTCKSCGRTFSITSNLNKHLNEGRCKGDQVFYGSVSTSGRFCSACVKTFSDASSFEQHECINKSKSSANSMPEMTAKFICKDCKRIFSHESGLEEHTCGITYACQYCGTTFARKSNLVRHERTSCRVPKSKIETETGDKYVCKWCKEHFSDPLGVQRHECLKYKCEPCGNIYSNASNLNRHIKSNCVPKYTCKVCTKIFSHESGLERHECLKYKCERCGNSYSNASNLNRHIKSNCVPKYTCKVCTKIFSHESGLERHECLKYKCERCGNSYSNASNLNRHINSKCVVLNPKTPSVSETSPKYTCKACTKIFSHELGLERHECLKYSCENCGNTYCNRQALRKHKCYGEPDSKTATGISASVPETSELFICKFCRRVCSDESELWQHECPGYACQYCRNTFSNKTSVNRHEQNCCKASLDYFTAATDGPDSVSETNALFMCGVCRKRFSDQSEIEQHECRSYFCQKCSSYFSTKYNLVRHERTRCKVLEPTTATATSKGKGYTCNSCNYTFNKKGSMIQHFINGCRGPRSLAVGAEANNHDISNPKEGTKNVPIKTFECPRCFARFIVETSLRRHTARHCKGKAHKHVCPVDGCKANFHRVLDLRHHLVDVHEYEDQVENLEFDNFFDFLKWKESTEINNFNYNRKLNGSRTNEFYTNSYYVCNFYGRDPKQRKCDESSKRRKSSSNRIGCPSRMVVRECNKTKQISVTHYTNHNHDLEFEKIES